MFKAITENFQYKIIAIALGVFAWYMIQGEEILEVNHPVQVSFVVPQGYMIKGDTTRTKDATLVGQRLLLGEFTDASIPVNARIILPRGKTGKMRILLSKQHILNVDESVQIRIHDPYLNVFVDEVINKEVPVRELFRGVPADGFIIEKTTLNPRTVRISGMKSELRKIAHVSTEPIDIEGIQKSTRFEAMIQTEEVGASEMSVDKIAVSLQVGEKKVNNRFTHIPIEVEGSAFRSEVKPEYASIVIQGTPGVLSFVKTRDLRAFVDARELSPGRYEKKIQVQIPPNTSLIETFPEQANIELFVDREAN